MNKSQIYKAVTSGLEKGIFQSVRLVQVKEGDRLVLIPFAKDAKDKNARWEHIKHTIDRKLGPGDYIIEARAGITPNSLKEQFSFKINSALPMKQDLQEGGAEEIQDHTINQEAMFNIDPEDYIETIKENERLKAELKNANDLIEVLRQNQNHQQGLNDAQVVANPTMKLLEDSIPTALTLLDQLLSLRNKTLDLKEKELDYKNGQYKKVVNPKTKPKPKVKRAMNDNEKLLEYFETLFEQDPDAAEVELDKLEKHDPETYDYVCEQLGLFDEEEGDEEEEDGGEDE